MNREHLKDVCNEAEVVKLGITETLYQSLIREVAWICGQRGGVKKPKICGRTSFMNGSYMQIDISGWWRELVKNFLGFCN